MSEISGIIKAICVSDVRGVQKKEVESAKFETSWGILGDAHGGNWHRQVSILSHDKIQKFNELGAGVSFGDFGENLVIEGIDFRLLPIGSQLKCGDCILEITQIGKECNTHCQIYHKMGDCIMPREGMFARVVQDGFISVGSVVILIENITKQWQAAILVLSDKASKGEREDESGSLIAKMLKNSGYTVIDQILLPDEQSKIEETLIHLADRRQVDLIITTGGTGFSHRDVTPEATLAVGERIAPGIAEAIRSHSMSITKRAMLSRGASVIRKRTLIVNLPGSPKAVRESLEFVLPHLEHGIEILRNNVQECATNDD
ncbi:MAG: molybdopterin-binding protein [Defluviitaleaceae bacterium]|nr:molybdopterin-binding protein [Defluviitaleaceae bacterium]